jgi:hypothetical protein
VCGETRRLLVEHYGEHLTHEFAELFG